MALIHRYSTELSISQDGHSSIAQIINDVTNCQRKDQEEKRCFHSLNDRLEGLLVDLNNLELANKSLRDQLNILITTWGIGGENRAEFLRDLDVLTRQLSETNLRRIVAQGETKIFEELTRFIDRFTSIYTDISHLYHDKTDFLIDLLQQFEDQFEKIHQRLNKSQSQLDIHHEDYLKDLSKYRSYLSEWSQIALDKQKLLNEIQTLREYLNLRSAFHREELNEWKRLLNRSSQDSEQYYRNYLETIRQQIQIDYEQMAKEQQEDVEIELNTRVKKIQTDLLIEEQTSNTNERFEMYLTEHERLQRDYRILTEEIQAKQRILRELQSKNHQRVHLEHETQLTREEYHQLKDELDQFAYTLRFSIEEELKIYETLLNTIERKTTDYRPLKTQSTRYTIAQSMLGLNEIQCEKRSVQWEEKYLQRRFRINRRYLGRLIKEISLSRIVCIFREYFDQIHRCQWIFCGY